MKAKIVITDLNGQDMIVIIPSVAGGIELTMIGDGGVSVRRYFSRDEVNVLVSSLEGRIG